MSKSLSFQDLRHINVARCNTSYFGLESWNQVQWANALAGEAGEYCNYAKKIDRFATAMPKAVLLETKTARITHNGAEVVEMLRKESLKELADVVIYADLAAAREGASLAELVIDKFNEKSLDMGSDLHLGSLDDWKAAKLRRQEARKHRIEQLILELDELRQLAALEQ